MYTERLPNDLAEYVRQKYTRFAVKCFIWLAVVVVAEVSFLYRLVVSYRGHIDAIVLLAVLVILPFIIFGGFKLIFDKSWEGKVILVEVDATVSHRMTVKGRDSKGRSLGTYINGHSRVTQFVSEIYVETDDGKVYTYVHVTKPPEKNIYNVGDRVKKYKGLPHPVNITSPKRECAVCSEENPADSHKCRFCGYSLIE